ncbi:Putative effector of murein hydrolase LgrB [Herminiimonas arsenicoxydans]|uniref:Effector of murein hydrolase LgrB n=1 Tax=Herminiimonas arsenicoxydans TaxID=204773 RepID=A4G8V5_HERAR|nr:Putative effector of murein hydrolase LgrB [Herminiimonas arsenicoxydans]
MPNLNTVWVYLAGSPLLWLTATLLAYRIANLVYEKTGRSALANPVAISVALLVVVLYVSNTPYKTYFDGAQFVHFLLGPVTVALAIPLYLQIEKLKRNWFALLAGALIGGAAAITCAMSLAWALGASRLTILSMAPKSVTIPIAMGITEKIGGLPTLTAVMVMLTGIFGAGISHYIFKLMKISDDTTCGFALGATAHGVGTARAFQVSEEAGAFSGLAMGLSGILTALLLPFVLKLLGVF